jgi:hypothetical protein
MINKLKLMNKNNKLANLLEKLIKLIKIHIQQKFN